jgi:hypothetical protein
MKDNVLLPKHFFRLLFILSGLIVCNDSFAQPVNDNCAGVVTVSVGTSCSYTTYNIKGATNAAPTGTCGGATATTTYDMWFRFQATASTQAISLANFGSSLAAGTTYMQVLSGAACAGFTSLACQSASTRLVVSGLTSGTFYYLRIYVTSSPTAGGSSTKYDYDMCLQGPPANDDCGGAISLTPGTTCSNTTGTLDLSTSTTGLPAGCESASTHYDVWYKFVAGSTYELITLSSLGANITSPELQLYSGTCGTLSSLACGTTSITYTSFTVGSTYYLRVSNLVSSPNGTGTAPQFSICVYHPASATYDYGKSYVNISKNSAGGTISPGDTLEIRGTLVIKSLSLDSLAFFDTLHHLGGLRLVPSTIILRTNEGKTYKAFTDAVDADAGHYYTNGLDTVIRINIGTGATATAKGKLLSTSKPSVFGATCIIMATYRVVVYAAYGATVNVGGGVFTIKDGTTGIAANLPMVYRNALVYSSPGLCPNAVSATNAIGGDNNGSFGTASGAAPLARNRGTSTNVPGYIYKTFATGQGPNDYYYGIANNTSATYSIVNTWVKPESHRVFDVWDIIGDHTGASNTAKGNTPCDTTKPVSATNPCGYMLVINSAYKTDTAFQYSVSNLCPNTYYEISAWVRNICSKCSCDSNGVGASGVGYIPFATGDSSGVQPNLAFDINGNDYYTTGNIPHYGVTANQQGSDSTNKWVKRGFTYLTGTTQTSLTLSIRNNAPGGGGNDWAIDDISLATCLPNMQYSPSLNPAICDSNSITIYDTIRSYFNNYTYYKWQRSTDGGVTWTDLTGVLGPATPVWNGTAYEYVTSYTVPPANTNPWNTGDKYRVVVATTAANVSNSNCQFTDGISIITLNVINCDIPLKMSFLSFSGNLVNDRAALNWTVSEEDASYTYMVERSNDGVNYFTAGTVNGAYTGQTETHIYSFTDPAIVNSRAWYRIIAVDSKGQKKYSRVIVLSNGVSTFNITGLINPFSKELLFDMIIPQDGHIEAILMDMNGRPVRQRQYTVFAGSNSLSFPNTGSLPSGVYVFQLRMGEKTINKTVLKQ